MTKRQQTFDNITQRQKVRDALPGVGTPISILMSIDGKMNTLEGDFIDVVAGYTSCIEGYFISHPVPADDDVEGDEESVVVSFVHASPHVVSATWLVEEDTRFRTRLVSIDGEKSADSDTIADKSNNVDENVVSENVVSENDIDADKQAVDNLRTLMHDAIASAPRAAIVSAVTSSGVVRNLRETTSDTAKLTK